MSLKMGSLMFMTKSWKITATNLALAVGLPEPPSLTLRTTKL